MTGRAELIFTDENTAEITISGKWTIYGSIAGSKECIASILAQNGLKSVKIITKDLVSWDTSLVNFLVKISEFCKDHALNIDLRNAPKGVKALMGLCESRETEIASSAQRKSNGFLSLLGHFIILAFFRCRKFLCFFGEICFHIFGLFTGRSKIRRQEFAVILQDVGVQALPIVSLISFLVGLIIAFVSVLQLARFGASIYVADLVGITMMREMGSIMAGVIMSGRTGAAFAATIGTMIVNDEVDALQTAGLSKIDFLVLPRVLALGTMMPFLCIFASFIGIFGGLCTTVTVTDLTVIRYCLQTVRAITINDFMLGVVKGGVFGLLIAITGCFKGLQCGHSAEDVGLSTTEAVVTSITAIIIADAIFAIIVSCLGI